MPVDKITAIRAEENSTLEQPVGINEKLFHRFVDYVLVYTDGRVVFTFRNGVEVST